LVVLAEIAGLVAGLVAGAVAYKASKIRTLMRFSGAHARSDGRSYRTVPQEADVEFEFDKIFKLRLKSKGYAQVVMWGLVAILFALAFLIVCVGIRTLGI